MAQDDRDYFVHESAYVDDGAEIGPGTKIWHFAHIMGGAKIGSRCIFGQNVMVAGRNGPTAVPQPGEFGCYDVPFLLRNLLPMLTGRITVGWVKRSYSETSCVVVRQTRVLICELRFGERRPTRILDHGGSALASRRLRRTAVGRRFHLENRIRWGRLTHPTLLDPPYVSLCVLWRAREDD